MIPSSDLIYPKSEAFTSSGTWSCPSQVEWIDVLLVAGGAGGGGGVTGDSSGGGGGGGEIKWRRMRVTGDVTVTIGAGGAGGASGVDGTDGSASTLADGCVLSAGGGKKGLKGAGTADGVGGNGGGEQHWTPSGTGTPVLLAGNGLCAPGGAGGKSNISSGTQYMASGVSGYSSPGATGASFGGGGGGSYGDGADGNFGAAGDSAVANTGGGGAGGGDGVNAAGAGATGYCIIFWVE